MGVRSSVLPTCFTMFAEEGVVWTHYSCSRKNEYVYHSQSEELSQNVKMSDYYDNSNVSATSVLLIQKQRLPLVTCQ